MNNSKRGMLKKLCCFALCAVMLAGAVGCAKDSPDDDSDAPSVIVDTFTITDPTKDTYVVKNGVSPYKILIQKDPSDQITLAARELQYFFGLITGVELEIVNDTGIANGKYFSIGETTIRRASGVSATYDELGTSGYKVKTYGDAVVMVGENDFASSYAVYGYLARQFGLEIYSDDCYRIVDTKEAKLIDIDWTDIPDIAFRNGGMASFSWYGSNKYMTRMRVRNKEDFFGIDGHTYLRVILPPSEYLADHPDWYDDAENPNEICKTNEEMKAQFIANVEDIILANPDKDAFMLGHEDGGPFCPCENCQAVRNQYNGSNTALEILFTNDVVRKINAWAAETIPDRHLQFCMFAYTTTEQPPVEYDGVTGTYYPINHDEKLKLESNLGVQIAPIGSHVSLPYMDQSYAAGVFNGWSVLTDNFYIWAYASPFSNYLTPFDGFGSYEQNIRDYVKLGANYVFIQGFGEYVGNFLALRDYLNAKLMWDSSLHTDDLVRDFMAHYYGPGWESIYEFYTLWRLRLTELMDRGMFSYCAGQLVQDWTQPDLFPKELLDKYEALFDKALEANEIIRESDPERCDFYRDNIRSDRCLVRYLLISTYSAYYDYDSYKAMIDEFSEISHIKGVTHTSESGKKIDDVIAEWNQILNQK